MTHQFKHLIRYMLAAISLVFSMLMIQPSMLCAESTHSVKPISEIEARDYQLDSQFFRKTTQAAGILIASSNRVSDIAFQEAAHRIARIMEGMATPVAKKIHQGKVRCVLLGRDELTSDLPQFATDKKGDDLDLYHRKNREFFRMTNGLATLVVVDDNLLPRDLAKQQESTLIRACSHLVEQIGFDRELDQQLAGCFENAKTNGLWNDASPARVFPQIESESLVSLVKAIIDWFPSKTMDLIEQSVESGIIIVNGKSVDRDAMLSAQDIITMQFEGPKKSLTLQSSVDYWSEGFQISFDNLRNEDEDHKHVHTRAQLPQYDPDLAKLCGEVLDVGEWRFTPAATRAGRQHLKDFQPKNYPMTAAASPIRDLKRKQNGKTWAPHSQRFEHRYVSKVSKHPVPESPLWLTYHGGTGPGAGMHIVLIAADQEYRSEQSMPMIAKILAKRHGFDCTVLFALNDKDEVDPTQKIRWQDKTVVHRIPGLEYLETADALILFSRLITLPDDQIAHIINYLDSGKPLVGIRTANHGFLENFPYKVNGKSVRFGDDVLGGSFRGHHGNWHADSTRGIIVEENREHPILTGVTDVWGPSDVYRTYPEGKTLPSDCVPLMEGQPLLGRNHDDPINPKKIALPIAWTKNWTGNLGKTARVFHTTMGSAKDFESEGLRRLLVNSVYWLVGIEDQIDRDASVDYVGQYKPLASGFRYDKLGVTPKKPEAYR